MKLHVHRMGGVVSLWKGTGSRVELDVEDVGQMLRALGFPERMTAEADAWAATIRAAWRTER